jgi:uncharacterized protein (DUF362 family)
MRKASRRQLLVGGAAVAAGGCFPDVGGEWAELTEACTDESTLEPVTAPSPVAEIFRDDAVSIHPTTQVATIIAPPVREMLDAVLTSLFPAGKPWHAILPDWTPQMRVGIKVNVLNPWCPTSPQVTRAIVDSMVEELGVSREQIIVWDRRIDELESCGFTEEAVGAKVMGTVDSVGYGEPECGVVAGMVPRLSRILTQLTDVTINVPVLKTHGICGVTGAMKNVYGVIHNPGDYHTNLNEALPQLYALPLVRNRFRFHILDALVAVTMGGTSSPMDSVPKRVLASSDPLALDRRALTLADEIREARQLGLKPVDRSATGWMENAHAAGLGAMDFTLRQI